VASGGHKKEKILAPTSQNINSEKSLLAQRRCKKRKKRSAPGTFAASEHLQKEGKTRVFVEDYEAVFTRVLENGRRLQKEQCLSGPAERIVTK